MKKRITLSNSQDKSHPDIEGIKTNHTPGAGLANLFDYISHLIHYRKFIIVCFSLTCSIAILWAVLTPNQYKSYSSILPSGQVDQMSQLKSLAGISSSASSGENSSELFPVILRSQSIRNAILDREYSFDDDGNKLSLTLSEYFDQDDPDLLRIKLKDITSVSIGKKTGVVSIAVETEYPRLSQLIAEEYINQLEEYNLYHRKSHAGENAEYLSNQIVQKRLELEIAEDSLQEFQDSNSDWVGSSDPETIKMLARLKRDVTVKSQTYLFLMQEYEAAKLDMKKDVPIVRILDYPTLPTVKTGPYRKMVVIITAFLTFIAAAFLSLIYHLFNRSSKEFDKDSFNIMRHNISDAFPRTEVTINRIRNRLKRRESEVV